MIWWPRLAIEFAAGHETDNSSRGGHSQWQSRLVLDLVMLYQIRPGGAGEGPFGLNRDSMATSDSDGVRRRLAGSRRGSAAVKAEFEEAITRRRYCELVGIHATTLKKWERERVVEPELIEILNSPTRVFTQADVRFGRRLIKLLKAHPGEFSVADAAARARRG